MNSSFDMSSACEAPLTYGVPSRHRNHPRAAAYREYEAALNRQLVQAMCFESWVEVMDAKENGRETVFHTLPGSQLAQGWYKHKFAPVTERMTRFGPFATQAEAEAA